MAGAKTSTKKRTSAKRTTAKRGSVKHNAPVTKRTRAKRSPASAKRSSTRITERSLTQAIASMLDLRDDIAQAEVVKDTNVTGSAHAGISVKTQGRTRFLVTVQRQK